MDERDAKHQKIEIHKREMSFAKGYVSCTSCAANYGQYIPDQRNPVFCQTFSMAINPSETEENIRRAEACKHWVHENLDRNKVITPAHDAWYEKDSLG